MHLGDPALSKPAKKLLEPLSVSCAFSLSRASSWFLLQKTKVATFRRVFKVLFGPIACFCSFLLIYEADCVINLSFRMSCFSTKSGDKEGALLVPLGNSIKAAGFSSGFWSIRYSLEQLGSLVLVLCRPSKMHIKKYFLFHSSAELLESQ